MPRNSPLRSDTQDSQDTKDTHDTHGYSDTQILGYSDTQARHANQERKLDTQAECVRSIHDAVALALTKGVKKQWELNLARAIRAFEVTTRAELPKAEYEAAFGQWWFMAETLGVLPENAVYACYLAKFRYCMSKVTN